MSKKKVFLYSLFSVLGIFSFLILFFYYGIVSTRCRMFSYGYFSKNVDVKIIIRGLDDYKKSPDGRYIDAQESLIVFKSWPNGKKLDECGNEIKQKKFTGFFTEKNRNGDLVSIFDVKEGRLQSRRFLRGSQGLLKYTYPENGGEIREFFDTRGDHLYTVSLHIEDEYGKKFSQITCESQDCTRLMNQQYRIHYR